MKYLAYAALFAPAVMAMISPQELIDSVSKCPDLPDQCAPSAEVLLSVILGEGGAGGDIKSYLAGLTADCVKKVDACIMEKDDGAGAGASGAAASSAPAPEAAGDASAAVEARGIAVQVGLDGFGATVE